MSPALSFLHDLLAQDDDIKSSTSLLSAEQSQQLIEYAQTVDEETLINDFSDAIYFLPRKLFSVLVHSLTSPDDAKKSGWDHSASAILQYFVICMSSVSNSMKLSAFFPKDEAKEGNIVEFANVLRSEQILERQDGIVSEELKFLILSFLASLLSVKSEGNVHPDMFQKNVKAQQEAFSENIQKAILNLIPVLLTLTESFTVPVINLIIAIHQGLATVQRRNAFIDELTLDYDAARGFNDGFLAQFNYLTLDIYNSLIFIQSVMALQDQRSDINLFLTNDINFLVDIILREEEKWSETLYAQDAKKLKTNPVLCMYETRLNYLKTLHSITKSKLYLHEKVTKEVYKHKEIIDILRKVLNEPEPAGAPKIFFTLKEEALEILDNKCFFK
ncbi:hypothetical protein C9374_004859 [Naegleria lovaniensis]|uniref:Uncharacterized protein n=1 Tax=Naegleria lovaniensis TaxID=51637 RepID=A0AA88KJ43_NAELO|nr:uncharacterized protein C9374_004859 [Naegleria lovaniensis]KAG2382892.1 hypothetical protein C9374_004859 [Naegleria lovaniensis]